MPIVHILSNEPAPEYSVFQFIDGASCKTKKPWPDGAYCSLENPDLVLYETHHGLCLWPVEHNGYDDSDFFMWVWNPERKAPEKILYASTRFWSYPAQASRADATPEVLDAYQNWNEERRELERRMDQKARVEYLLVLRALEKKVAHRLKVPRKHCIRARRPFGHVYCVKLYKLILSNRVSNRYKLSLKQQATKWLSSPNPGYSTPLSRRQKIYL